MTLIIPFGTFGSSIGMYRLVHVIYTYIYPRRVHAVFFDSDPVKFCARLLCAIAKTSPVAFLFCFCFLDFSTVVSLGEMWSTLEPSFSAKKAGDYPPPSSPPEVRPRDGHLEHVCKISWATSQKRPGYFYFCA